MGRYGADLRIQRYVATGDQHQHNHHHVLMVFLIQNTQNRDSIAVQLKLDELICALERADNRFLDVEELDEKDLETRRKKMVGLAEKATSVGVDVGNISKPKPSKKAK
jgi:low affinity Fe/Cu permease